jgi:2',3'-cyclic-nucleotide 2'-phosphodiesterase (5'-nucleotidase family)
VRTFGGLKVGFIGLCLTTTEISPAKLAHTRLDDPIEAAGRYLPMLQREGAQVIVAVTHLAFADDRRLVERFPQIDLIIGGHEHFPITATERGTLISKAGADARWVARIDVNRRMAGSRATVERFFELMPVTADVPDDPKTAEVVREYETKLGTELETVVGESAVPLDAQSVRLRAAEQPLGNLVADAMREEMHADVGIANAGSIRGDRVYPAGPLTRRTLVTIHPFGNVLCKIEVTGRVMLQALNAGVAKLPASAGQFPQVSGLTMTVDASAPAGNRVRDVQIGGEPLDPAKTYTVALPDFVMKGGDDYAAFIGQRALVGPEAGPLIVTALEHYVAAHRPVAPKVEGRITIVR